jgi:hypothetical protein
MVRRAAFEAAGGFREGLRAAEDTDLCWRLQDLGWSLELREQASVLHEYRTTLRGLLSQWRSYAAGRAWLAREYPDFHPQTAASRWLRRASSRGPRPAVLDEVGGAGAGPPAGTGAASERPGRLEALQFFALDALLALNELVGMRMDNRPSSREELQ